MALIACKTTKLEWVQLALSQKPTECTEPIESLVQKQVGFRNHTVCLCKSLCLHSQHENPASRTPESDNKGVLLSIYFHSLIKMLYWLIKNSGEPFQLTVEQLQHSILRNFGGSRQINPLQVFEACLKNRTLVSYFLVQSMLPRTPSDNVHCHSELFLPLPWTHVHIQCISFITSCNVLLKSL